MKRILTCCLVLLLASLGAQAQRARSESIRPAWLKAQPVPSNGTFHYVVKQDFAASLEEARRKCLNDLVLESGLEGGMVVVTDINSRVSDEMVWENGRLVNRGGDSFDATTRMTGSEHTLAVKNIAEYWERDATGNYHLYNLFARSNSGQTARFDEVALTTRYGARGVWRSAIVPGWGQMYKGSTGKGIAMLAGVVVSAGGIVFCENVRSSYIKQMNNAMHDESKARSYYTTAQNYAVYRNICIGACAAIYLYSLIDAAVAPGGTRIVPIITSDGGAGLSYRTNF